LTNVILKMKLKQRKQNTIKNYFLS